MKSFIVIFLSCLLAFPLPLLANPPAELPPQPKILGIQKGEPAPFSGVLLNPLAAANIFSEKNYSIVECDLRVKYAVEKELARVNLLLETTKVSMDAMDKRYSSIIQIKDKEIERLSAIAVGAPNDYSAWWAAGGVLVGIGLTLAVVYAVKEI